MLILFSRPPALPPSTVGDVSVRPVHIVTIHGSPRVEFYRQDGAIPWLAGLHYRRLLAFEPFHRPCGGVIGGSENSNGEISLDNADGLLSRLWRVPPLRTLLTHDVVLNGVRKTIFSGSVSRVQLGAVVTITVEA